jgi:hypothetical protein
MFRRYWLGLVAAGLAAVVSGVSTAADEPIDKEGFIREWLVLAPIPMDAEEVTEGVDKQLVKDEAGLAPKAWDKSKAGTKELTWKKYTAKNYYFDLNDAVSDRLENVAGYAVTYVVAPEDMTDVTLKVGSNDLSKTYLNGKEIGKNIEPRATEKDQDTISKLSLKKGTNVLVFKVLNQTNDWTGAARFVGKDGNPIKGLKVQLEK